VTGPSPLAAALAARIAREGPLTIDSWMSACLADPEHGYYRRARPLGAAGDFVTAPEISQIFGELVGAWAATVWTQLGRPTPLRLVELGPGSGALLADARRALARPAADFLAAATLHLVEINTLLCAAQRAALGDGAAWHESIDEVPPGPAIVLGNEFLDALPIRQLIRDGAGWRERVVARRGDGFAAVAGPAVESPDLAPAQAQAADGAIVELGVGARAFVARLAARLAREGGAALFVDYGPPASGVGETLQAASRHATADPFARPGEVDLTAHVDFAALGATVARAGMRAWGPVPQGRFLARLGLHARAARLAAGATAARRAAIEQGVARLIGDSEMGTLFKAFAITAPDSDAPPGFDPIA
jgi:NADH dehydrogenase [ubiquinone] 1 alpha subcomplex assembly factor 7